MKHEIKYMDEPIGKLKFIKDFLPPSKIKIKVKVHARSKKSQVLKKQDGQYEVWVREPADKGRANEAVIEALSEHLIIPKSKISILRGHQSKLKLVEVGL